MNKRLIILVLLAAFLLSAVSPWPAILTVYNGTGDNIYFRLKYRGEQKYFLTATPEGNSADYHISRFDIVRRTYTGNEVTACATTTPWARLVLTTNLWLNFTPCESMRQWWTPKYWGEPGMEKPNFYNDGDFEWTPPDWGWWGGLTYKACVVSGPKLGACETTGGRAFHFLYDVVP